MAALNAFRVRRVLWGVMLGLFALAVAGAAWIILTQHHVDTPQIVLFAIFVPVIAGLILGASKLVDVERMRWTGVFAMVLLVIEFVLVMVAIGSEADFYGELAGCLGATLIPAFGLFQAIQHRGGRVSGIAGLSLLTLAMVVLAWASWIENARSLNSEFYWETGWYLWLSALVVAICLAGAGTDGRHWRWLGAAAAVGAMIVESGLISFREKWTIFAVLGTIALLAAHANLALLWPLRPSIRWARWVVIAAGLVAAPVWGWGAETDAGPPYRAGTQYNTGIQIGLALAIFAGAGNLGLGLISLITRKPEPIPSTLEFKEISIVCPHCQTSASMALGNSACIKCGLKFSIKVEEPHCAQCGYMLLMNASDRCPECGTPITGVPPTTVPIPATVPA